MFRKLLAAMAAFSVPGIALSITAERLIRPRVFYSGPWHRDPPATLGWAYEEAHMYTPDGIELQGWWFPAREANAPTILFMHGTSYNASDMWVSEERSIAFREFLEGIGANFLVFDYRGYGPNAGTPTEEGTYTDAATALGWLNLRDDIDHGSIFYYGFSLGTGIAAGLALREPPAGLILRAPFTSIRDMAIDRHAWLRRVFAIAPWLPLTNYDTLAKTPRLECPLLVMHGDNDKTVPEYMGRRIFDAAREPKTYASFPGSGHSDVGARLVVPPITAFMRATLERRAAGASAPAVAAAQRA